MPRTRQVKKSENRKPASLANGKTRSMYLEEWYNIYKMKREEILQEKADALASFRMTKRRDRITVPVSLGHATLKDLKLGNISLHSLCSSNLSLMSSVLQSKNDNTKKSTKDEGRSRRSRTLERSSISTRSQSTTAKKTTRASRSLSRTRSSSTNRRSSRSSSTSHLAVPSKPTNNKFKTPLNNRKLSNFGMVTPKMKPNTPHVVLRRPQIGEMAISLQGSPLMTTAMVTETTANVNIPLPDGRLINIQPMKGLRASEIPELDPEIRRQLQTLRENLDKVCQFAKRK